MKEELKKVKETANELYKAIYDLEIEINKHIEIAQNDYVEIETVDQAIKYISDRFYDEMIKHNNNIKNIQKLFIYWLNGLALNTYYYTDDIINYLHSIGLYGKDEEQEQEKAGYLYHYLIFKEIKDHIYKII